MSRNGIQSRGSTVRTGPRFPPTTIGDMAKKSRKKKARKKSAANHGKRPNS
jgi:hypothetical protein